MTDPLPNPVSLETAMSQFETFLKSQSRSSSTLIAYHSDISQLSQYLISHRITQATTVATPHLQDYVTHLSSNGYTPKSVSRKINSLKTFFKFLHAQKLTPSNPSLPLDHPKFTSLPPRILTPAEYKALRESARLDIRMSAIVELLLQTGIRISELANLHLEDIKKNELDIRTLENNSARTIPLSKTASACLQNYLKLRPQVSNPHIFVTKTGRPLLIRNIRTSIDRHFKTAGVKNAKVNDLRHTFIAHQLAAGVEPQYLSKLIGHKRLTSTTKYLDLVRASSTVPTSRLTEL